MVSVCPPSDALLQHLPSYLGFSYLGHGVCLHGCSSKQYCTISWRSLERITCFWYHMNSIRDWAQLRLQCKFLRFWLGGGAEIYWSSCGHLRQAWNEVPLLPKPATTNQEWPASFSSASLPSVSRDHFQISPRELPRLWIDISTASHSSEKHDHTEE